MINSLNLPITYLKYLFSKTSGSFFSRFYKNIHGVAAIEFALILPLMLTIWLGSVELNRLLTAKRKLDLVARTVSDLTARIPGVAGKEEFYGTWQAIPMIMAPLEIGPLTISITNVGFFLKVGIMPTDKVGAEYDAVVCWGNAWIPGGGPGFVSKLKLRKRGDVIDNSEIPDSFRLYNTSAIWVEVYYEYVPVTSWLFRDHIHLKSEMFMPPRYNLFIPLGSKTGYLPNSIDRSCRDRDPKGYH